MIKRGVNKAKFDDFDLDLSEIKNDSTTATTTITGICCGITKNYLTACEACSKVWPVTSGCSPSDMTACDICNRSAEVEEIKPLRC